MEMKRIGQFEVDSGKVLIVDAAYVGEPQEGATWAAVSAKGDGVYPVYEFEHEGTIYAAFPIRPADSKTWEGVIGFAADRLQDAIAQEPPNKSRIAGFEAGKVFAAKAGTSCEIPVLTAAWNSVFEPTSKWDADFISGFNDGLTAIAGDEIPVEWVRILLGFLKHARDQAEARKDIQ